MNYDEIDDAMEGSEGAEPEERLDAEQQFQEALASKYWAAMPSDKFAAEAEARFDAHVEMFEMSGVGETISRSYRMYHSMDAEGHNDGSGAPMHMPNFVGEQGEFVYTEVNHYRNHILHQKSLVLSERPAFEAHASTNSSDAMEQVELADHVLQYAMDNRNLALSFDTGVETALIGGAGWVRLGWDPHATGSGDLEHEVLGVLDVAYQKTPNIQDAEWMVARSRHSKWRLAAEARNAGDPKLAMAILEAAPPDEGDGAAWANDSSGYDSDVDEDMVPLLYVYCKPTPQLPEGRYARIIPGGVVVEDTVFPFHEIPLYDIIPNVFVGTTIPYSNSWDLMPLQTLENACLSAITTRIDAFGVPNIAYQVGTEIGVHENGLATWAVPPGGQLPTVLDFLSNNPALTGYIQLLESMADKLSGVNSVVRGQPAENISSGSMAALVEAQAVKFNSPTDRAITYAAERIGTGVIRMYQAFAMEPMLLSITGGGNGERIVREFQAGSLDKIAYVSVQRTNPLTRTNAWKQDAANQLLAQGVIQSPHEYLAVAKTGRYTALFSDAVALRAHIDDENSRMLRGEKVEAADLENHQEHFREHMAKLDSRTRDFNPEAAQALFEHCMDHLNRWTQTGIMNPGMLQAIGIQALQPPLMAQQQMAMAGMMQPGQQPGQPPGQEPQQGGAPKGKPGPAPDPKVQGKTAAGADRMPDMPEPAEVKE